MEAVSGVTANMLLPGAELAGRVAKGDQAAFRQLMLRHDQVLYRTASSRRSWRGSKLSRVVLEPDTARRLIEPNAERRIDVKKQAAYISNERTSGWRIYLKVRRELTTRQ